MRKNNMRTPEDKEKIIKRYLSGESATILTKEYGLPDKIIYKWLSLPSPAFALSCLKSNTGKSKGGNKGLGIRKPKNKIEELEFQLLKKDIEIARLKKGYTVKGVGQKKEYVTTFNKNTK